MLRKFWNSYRETKFFILMFLIYVIALVWSTVQSYARLEYSRSDRSEQIVIQQPSENE